MVVYADVLIFLNALVTYFLLLSVCTVLRLRPQTKRLIFGAVFGGFSALIIFLPDMNFIIELLIRAAICTLTVLITFSYKNRVYFLKRCLLFLTVSYIFAGGMLALWNIFKPNLMVFGNGVAYFDISPIILILSTAVIYLFLCLISYFRHDTKSESIIYNCEITQNQKHILFQAVLDTGNSLYDPYFNTPVVIVESTTLSPILNEIKKYLIPVKSVVSSGMLKAFRPDSFFVITNGKKAQIKDVTIAICEEKVHTQFSGILPPAIINYTEEETCILSKK